MNRNEAKIWAKLSREELKEIGKIEYEKHYDFICAFGSGAEIESKHIEGTKWVEDNYPEFLGYMEYRVKPSAEQPAEQEEAESVVKENLTTEPTEKLVEALDGKPLTIIEAYAVRQLRASDEPINTHFLTLNKNEFDFLLALRRMMKENMGAKN